MKTFIRFAAALTIVALVAAPTAWAADKDQKNQPAASPSSQAPARISGEVVSVDPDKGVMMVRFPDGTTQEFHGNKETLSEYKVGDKIEGKLRSKTR
jgi:hypothetical protein